MAMPPARSISAATARPASSFRSTMPTLAPSAANRSDEAPPMPVAPPEINALFPANLPGMCFHPSSQKPPAILERHRLRLEVVWHAEAGRSDEPVRRDLRKVEGRSASILGRSRFRRRLVQALRQGVR